MRGLKISCAKVALDVPLAKLFDYAITGTLEVRAGDRVIVPFGARQRIGVVVSDDATSELAQEKLKSISAVRDEEGQWQVEPAELHRVLPARCSRSGAQ